MNKFIDNLSTEFDIQIPFSKGAAKGYNSYSLDQDGNIKALFLNDVNLKNLDFCLPIADKLEVLSLENCSIERVNSPGAFSNLKKLSLGDNPFEQSALDSLIQLQNLKELDLSMTEIVDTTPFSALINLTRLDLSFNFELYEVKGLGKLNNLTHFDFQYSKVDDLNKIEISENIEFMNIHAGKFTKIASLERYPNLRGVDLGSSRINKIEGINHLTKLERLLLSATAIEKIEGLSNLVNLERLDLSMNEISKIEGVEQLKSLKQLNLLQNKISKVENLDNLNYLEYLLFDANRISEFDSTFLNNLNSQCYISLIGNPMTQLDIDVPDNITVQFDTDHWVPRSL